MTWRSALEPDNGHVTHMGALRVFGPLAVVAVLSGCSGFGAGNDIERVRDLRGAGDDFTQVLTPDRDPITLLDAGVRMRFSDLADYPQGCFDCGFEPPEEHFQPGHGAPCRDGPCAAPQKLRVAMAAKLEPKAEIAPPPARSPENFLLYFTFDSDKLTAAGEAVVDAAVMAAGKIRAADFAVTGHAGPLGSDGYNMDLSLRRANAVREALIARGIDPARISVAGQVEVESAVATSEEVSGPAGRRVDMFVLK